jgi:hypothetical protein
MIKVSHEVPLSFLNESRQFNDYDYCLPHLLDQYEVYHDYFVKSKELGRYIVMDNSLHELGKAYDKDRLLHWVYELEPDEFIVPDVWENMNQTIINARYWIQIELPEKTTKVAVAQGKNQLELANCIETFKLLGYKKYALSYGAEFYNEVGSFSPNKDLSKMFGRIDTVNNLHKLGVICNSDRVHLLGCSLPQEFGFYENAPYIESIDTSNPIMAAIELNKYKINGLLTKPKANMNTEFTKPLNIQQQLYIKHNVELFRKINNL